MGYGIWNTERGIWDLGFGIWDLGFGICNVPATLYTNQKQICM